MTSDSDSEFAAVLQRFSEGDEEASKRLMALLYSELHQVARRCMSKEPQGHTLQATALVSEAYLKLLGKQGQSWTSRQHLIAAAAKAMRWVLVDHARKRANRQLVDAESSALDSVLVTFESRAIDLLALEEALKELALRSPKMARAVELRFFAGLSLDEVADVLEMPRRSLMRQWETARAWLFGRIS